MSAGVFTVFYYPGANAIHSADEIPEEAVRGLPSLEAWKEKLAPVLPKDIAWSGLTAERANMDLWFTPGDFSSFGMRAACDNDRHAMFRRMHEAGCWIVISSEAEGGFVDLSRPFLE